MAGNNDGSEEASECKGAEYHVKKQVQLDETSQQQQLPVNLEVCLGIL